MNKEISYARLSSINRNKGSLCGATGKSTGKSHPPSIISENVLELLLDTMQASNDTGTFESSQSRVRIVLLATNMIDQHVRLHKFGYSHSKNECS
jgi:hypothetical protein